MKEEIFKLMKDLEGEITRLDVAITEKRNQLTKLQLIVSQLEKILKGE